MTWADFYLICFLLGLALSLLSAFTGSAHLHLHLPHVHVPHVHGPHMHAGGGAEGVPWLNFGTMTAFLAWFGGTGYLLERFYAVWFLVALATVSYTHLDVYKRQGWTMTSTGGVTTFTIMAGRMPAAGSPALVPTYTSTACM